MRMNLKFEILNLKFRAEGAGWLPDMDLNHDKQIQSLLCYRYTIGQNGALRLPNLSRQSSRPFHSTHSAIPNRQSAIS
jgi:hypothetical protein